MKKFTKAIAKFFFLGIFLSLISSCQNIPKDSDYSIKNDSIINDVRQKKSRKKISKRSTSTSSTIQNANIDNQQFFKNLKSGHKIAIRNLNFTKNKPIRFIVGYLPLFIILSGISLMIYVFGNQFLKKKWIFTLISNLILGFIFVSLLSIFFQLFLTYPTRLKFVTPFKFFLLKHDYVLYASFITMGISLILGKLYFTQSINNFIKKQIFTPFWIFLFASLILTLITNYYEYQFATYKIGLYGKFFGL